MKQYILLVIILIIQITNSISQDLDLTFNSNGINQFKLGTSNDVCKSMALDNNGNVIMAGISTVGSYNQFSVARLSSNGSFDATFDSDGKKILSLGTTYGASATCVEVQSNNKIVIAGYYGTSTDYDLSVAKLNTDGSFDNTFDSDGILLLHLTNNNDYASALAIQSSDNKIIIVGQSVTDSLFAIRLNTDGSLDNTFDSDGKVFFQHFNPTAVSVQSNGKILITGSYNGDVGIIRLNADGSFDTSFDTDGIVTIDFGTSNDIGNDIIVLASGKIFVGGGNGSDFIGVRLNTNGSLDTTFDSDGKVTIDFENTDFCHSVSEDNTTNDIILVGYAYNLIKSDFAICRLSSSGSVNAKVIMPIGSGDSQANSVIIQSDRKVVVTGTASNGTTNDFVAIRLVPDFITTATLSSENIITGINLFPNPASQNINIHSVYNIQQIKVIDILGNELINVTSSGNTQVDISLLPKGLYNFVITTDKGTGNKKVSVQ